MVYPPTLLQFLNQTLRRAGESIDALADVYLTSLRTKLLLRDFRCPIPPDRTGATCGWSSLALVSSAVLIENAGRFDPITFCPGYLRGLDFIGNYAVVGLSKTRDEVCLKDLPVLAENLASRKASPTCGIFVIDLRAGDIVHWLKFKGCVQELYNVSLLPGVRCPAAIDFRSSHIGRGYSIAPPQPLPHAAKGFEADYVRRPLHPRKSVTVPTA